MQDTSTVVATLLTFLFLISVFALQVIRIRISLAPKSDTNDARRLRKKLLALAIFSAVCLLSLIVVLVVWVQ